MSPNLVIFPLQGNLVVVVFIYEASFSYLPNFLRNPLYYRRHFSQEMGTGRSLSLLRYRFCFLYRWYRTLFFDAKMKESLSGKYYFSNFKYSTPRIGKLFLLS